MKFFMQCKNCGSQLTANCDLCAACSTEIKNNHTEKDKFPQKKEGIGKIIFDYLIFGCFILIFWFFDSSIETNDETSKKILIITMLLLSVVTAFLDHIKNYSKLILYFSILAGCTLVLMVIAINLDKNTVKGLLFQLFIYACGAYSSYKNNEK